MHWLDEPQPVVVVLYDAEADRAYWVYIQSYFQTIPGFQLSSIGASTTVYLDVQNVLDEEAMRGFAGFRDSVSQQMKKGRLKHNV